MLRYIIERIMAMIPTVLIIAVLGFIIIELPPGDYLTYYLHDLESQGNMNARMEIQNLRMRYALDRPAYERFFNWVANFARGDFGDSFAYRKPVKQLIGERLLLTIAVSLLSMALAWGIGIPIGVYSATHQYSFGDHLITTLALIGVGVPGFLLALVFLVAGFQWFGYAPTGLFSPAFEGASWSLSKVVDLLKHIWVPAAIVAISGTAGLVRTMRANLLDVLRVNYVQAARAKGLSEAKVIWKHAVRTAIHPLVMSLGMSLAFVVSGSEITGIVLNLPTTGPLYLQAVRQQDTYLAGTFLILLALMLVIGNLLADILLVIVDPRIRYD